MAANANTTPLTRKSDAAVQPKTNPPSLPHSVSLTIADPPMVEVERNGLMVMVPGAWRVPDVLPLPELIEQGRQAVAATLTPAGDQGVADVMMPLLLTTQVPATQGMGDGTVQSFYSAMATEYRRHLRDVPLDILKAASDACVRESEFFPAVASLLRHAKPELEKRRRQADRIKALIDARNRPAPKPAFVREPIHVRLLTTLKHQEHQGSQLYSPDKAAKTRRELARLAEDERVAAANDGRACEEWAMVDYTAGLPPAPADPEPATPPARVGAFKSAGLAAAHAIGEAPRQLSPKADAALKRSLARQHRERGNTAYAETLERQADALAPRPPDVHTDIPEADGQEQEP